MMKKRLSKDEYNELSRDIKAIRDLYWKIFRQMTGRFPKNSKAIKSLLRTNLALMSLAFDVEAEFPNEEEKLYVDHQ